MSKTLQQAARSDKKILVGIGEVLWDVYPNEQKLGGAPANFACHVAGLGVESYLLSSVGNDALGDRVIEELSQRNVNTDYVERSSLTTGRVLVTVFNDGQPEYEIENEVAWDDIADNDSQKPLAQKCDAVCFGTLGQRAEKSRSTIWKFLAATSVDCLRVFDVNLRQNFYSTKILGESLRIANVLKLNQEELPVVCQRMQIVYEAGQEIESVKALQAKFALKLVALTNGAKGSILFDGKAVDVAPAPSIEVLDSVGAGDAFAAVLTVGMLRRESLSAISKKANCVASLVCSQNGATPIFSSDVLNWNDQS